MSNRTIWKYTIPINVLTASSTTVQRIPDGARYLDCGLQAAGIALWYEIPEPAAGKVPHRFQLFGTGTGPIGDHLRYVGTVQVPATDSDVVLVLHVYEVIEP